MDFTERIRLLIDAESKGAVQELDKLNKSSREADTSFDKMARSMGISGATLRTGLVAGATAFIGTGLVAYLSDVVTGFAEAAKAAGDLAGATGSNIETVSRMQAALQDAGVSAEQSAGMLTKFTTAASGAKGAAALQALNVELVKGKDGATDYAATMVAAVDSIMAIGDASERNRQLVALFGKAGAQAFQDMISSGMSLSEAMEAIADNRVFTSDDARLAAEFDEAMDSLAATTQTLGRELGRVLVPAVDAFLGILLPLVDVLGQVPTSMYLIIGAAWALNAALKSSLVSGAASSIGTMVAQGATSLAILRTEMSLTAATARTASAGIKAAFASNPVGWVLLAIGAVIEGAAALNRSVEASVSAAVPRFQELTDAGMAAADAANQIAAELEESNSALKDLYSSFGERATDNWLLTLMPALNAVLSLRDAFSEGGKDAEHYAEELQRLADEQGAMAALTADAEVKQRSLNDLLAEGSYTAAELADAVNTAGQAQADKNRIDDEANRLMDAYAAASWDAWDATMASIDAEYAYKDAKQAKLDAIAEEGSHADEVAQAALRQADAVAKMEEQTALLSGELYTAADAHDAMVASLERQLKNPDLTKEERAAIQDLIDKLKTAQDTAGEGIEIGGVRFKEGTEASVVEDLNRRIQEAMDRGDIDMAGRLQAQLDSLKFTPVDQVINIVGPDGQPLGADGVTIPVTTTGVDAAQAALDSVSGPVAVDVSYTVHGLDEVNGYNDDLDGKELDITARYVVEGLDAVNRYNDSLDGKQLDIRVEYNVSGLDAVNRYNDSLDGKHLDIYVQYHRLNSVPAGVTDQALHATNPVAWGWPAPSPAATPTVVNQTFHFAVSGAASPEQTAREMERRVRRAGDRSLASVTAP